MHTTLRRTRWAALAAAISVLGCGGSNASSPGNGTVNLMLSDDPVADWATIGVKVRSVSLTPVAGGTPVTIYNAPASPPVVNLVQLDQLSELLGDFSVPEGTYSRATITIAANQGDILLVASADPDPGFAGSAGETVPSADIAVRGAVGPAGAKTATVTVNLESPLVVAAGQPKALDLEFDLSHPLFIVDHVPAGGGAPTWVVSFGGPVRHRAIRDIRRLVLRHLYGSVTSVDPSGASLTFTRVHPALPATEPETAVTTARSLEVLADAINGTIFRDLDARTAVTIESFSTVASSLADKYIRVAARYQADGSLVAVRVWASSTFEKVWRSPEGHVLHVGSSTLTVANENGRADAVAVNASTKFFFRTPERTLDDATPIGTGPAFLANLKRGFKVHVDVDPDLAPTTLVARSVDIEIARFDGAITNHTAGQDFTYTRAFSTPADDYVMTLDYLSSATTNGKDASGTTIHGFKWWDFAFPTLVDTGATAIPDFEAAIDTTVSFGGSVGDLKPWGVSYASWADPADPSGWSANFTILMPRRFPLGQVAAASPWASTVAGGTFGMTLVGNPGGNAVPVDVSAVPGSATLVYDVNQSLGVVTVTPVDVTTAAGLATASGALVNPRYVKVFGVPAPDGHVKAYVLFYFTGTAPVR